MAIRLRTLIFAGALIFVGGARAVLVDIPGQNYSDDTSTGLRWLDVGVTSGLTYDQLMQGLGNSWYANGWRLATGEELSALYSSNLPSLTTAPALDSNGQPFYGGAITDFYAPTQPDPTQSIAKFISVLGGQTLTFGSEAYGLLGLIDRAAICTGGCSAHAVSTVAAYYDGRGEVSIAGGMVDNSAHPWVGRFLVTAQVSAVPEPEAYALALAGLGVLGLAIRRRKGAVA